MKNIDIIGAGSHTRSAINLLKHHFRNTHFYLYDNSFNENTEEFIHDIKLIGKEKDITRDNSIFLSIGNNKKREDLFIKYQEQVLEHNLFHPKSYQEQNLKIGKSNQLFANIYLNSYVQIGDNNIINTGAIIEHESIIGNHNHISVGSIICGRVKIGNRCFIGAGSTVVQNITKPGTYVGTPAKRIK